METKTMEKILDMAGSAAKVAANLSEPKKKSEPKQEHVRSTSDDSNNAQTGNQSVIVAVDKGRKHEPKPVTQHIHEFPENRSLTSEECELALKKAQMEYEQKARAQAYFEKMQDREWQHKLEVEKQDAKKGKIRRVIACVCGALGIGIAGYGIYADYRDRKAMAMGGPALPGAVTPATPVVKAEGDVK